MIIRNVIDENNVIYNAGRVFKAEYNSTDYNNKIINVNCPEYSGEQDAIIMINSNSFPEGLDGTFSLCVTNSKNEYYENKMVKAKGDNSLFGYLSEKDLFQGILLFQRISAVVPPHDEAERGIWGLINARNWPKVYKNIEKKVEPWSHFGLYIDSSTGELKTDKDNVYVNSYDDPETGELKYEIWDGDSNKSWTVDMSNETCFIVISITPNILTFV